jgi:glycerophosphoryl diester phosphodiesterase
MRTHEIIAHRGYSAIAPENTLVALARALEAGADALEWDVQMTADGVPVLLHDELLDRTTDGTGAAATHTLESLRSLDAGSWFGPEFAGERVPTVAEALALARARCRRIYPELKGRGRPEDAEAVVRLVRESGWEDDCVLISMDWTALAAARAASDRLAIGYIVEAEDRFAAALELAAADGRAIVDCDVRLLLERPTWAGDARRAGVELAVWTVDDATDARLVSALGVRRLTTNQVERIRDAVSA